MSGPWHPTGRARVSARRPSALGICDRCGFTYNLKDLRWQYQWAGAHLQNLRLLVCENTCLDIPQEQLRSIIIPPDPLPVFNPRPEQYTQEVPSYVATESPAFAGTDITTEDGNKLIWEIEDTPSPDPNNPVIYPPGTTIPPDSDLDFSSPDNSQYVPLLPGG